MGRGELALTLPVEGNAVSRLVQIILCVVGLLVLSPLLALIAVAVKLTSPGPILYRGQRVGKDERPFAVYKFRTLKVGAEKEIGARLLREEDPIYTPLGKLLKRTKLDEIPQLFNVLKGEMSLVGPRPVRPIFLETFKDEISNYASRFRVRPGMTGLAQLRGGYWTDPRDKLRYELIYINNQSILLDLKLIALTFLKLFNRLVTTGVALAALFLFASFFPTSLHPWLYVVIFGAKVNFLHLLIMLSAAWMLARKTYTNRLFIYRSPMYLPMAGFLAAGLVSAILSKDPETAIRGVAYYVATGFLVASSLLHTKITGRFVRSAATVVGLACGVLSFVGLFELAIMRHLVQTGVSAAEAARLVTTVGMKATFASANVLSAYLVLGFPLLLCQLVHAKTRAARDFWLVGTTIAFTSLLLTQDLHGLVALFTACAIFLASTSFRTVALLVCIFLVPVLVLGAWEDSAPFTKAYDLLQMRVRHDLEMLASVPVPQLILGSGLKTVQSRLTPGMAAASDVARSAAENMHLTLILEAGIVGWFFMLWILWVTLRTIYRGARQATDLYQRSLLWAIFSSVVGFLISMTGFNVFFHIPLQILFWGLVGLGFAVVTHVVGRRRSPLFIIWRFGDERPPKDRRKRSRSRRGSQAVVPNPTRQAGMTV